MARQTEQSSSCAPAIGPALASALTLVLVLASSVAHAGDGAPAAPAPAADGASGDDAAPGDDATPAGPVRRTVAPDAEPLTVGSETIVIVDTFHPPPAGLDDLVGDDTSAHGRERALSDPPFVTIVRVDDREGETTSVAEALAQGVGVQVRSVGGLGSFASLSVRGAAPGHTAVLVDGVPLSRVASVTTDLGQFELSSFSQLELYRGGVPVSAGGSALGGALDLETRVGPGPGGERWRLSAGGGSFGARHLRVRHLGATGDGSRAWHLAAGYAGATGDHVYLDDNGTNLVLDDDRWVRRTNNGYDAFDLVARGRVRSDGLSVTAGSRTLVRAQGIPGTGAVQSETASLDTASELLDAGLEVGAPFGVRDLAAEHRAFVFVEHQRYRDLDGEIGVGVQDRRYLTTAAGASTTWTLLLADGEAASHRLAAGLDLRADYFRDDDLLMDDGLRTTGWRAGAGLAIADDIGFGAGGEVVIQPALRLDIDRSDPIADGSSPLGPRELPSRTDLHPSPRIAARVRLAAALSLKGSAGWYHRAPTLLELYGDRGFIVGNPDLRAETGVTADAGAVLAPERGVGPIDRIYAEAVAFTSRPRDTIAFISAGGLVARPQNVGDARTGGAELVLSARLARTATVTANYTWLGTAQEAAQPTYDGKALPQRPRHQLYGRVDVARTIAGRVIAIWADGAYTAGSYLDLANNAPLPARALIGAGLRAQLGGGFVLGVEAKNLADARVETVPLDPPPRPDLTEVPRPITDFGGFPLPGRAFYATLEWSR